MARHAPATDPPRGPAAGPPSTPSWASLTSATAASSDTATVLATLQTSRDGLSSAAVAERQRVIGANAVRSHHARPLTVLLRQMRSALLGLLFVTAIVSFVVGERTDAVIITTILAVSVGLGFVNEYRAELAAEALHSEIRHLVTVRRDGRLAPEDVTHLVPGDIVMLDIGTIVPADLRLLEAVALECDESVLTGESVPTVKSAAPVAAGAALADTTSCLYMGTIVHEGSATAVVVATGGRTEFGKIALGLGDREPQTAFQVGLRDFSALLARVAGALAVAILAINIVLRRPVIDAVLFSLAIAVGITPQLLPAVVSTSLAIGSRRLAAAKVLVKRLVCIEDLGDIDVLFTDKTGTLTDGHITFEKAVDAQGAASERVFQLGLVCNQASIEHDEVVGGNPLDTALMEAADPAARAAAAAWQRLALLPFDHDRLLTSVLARHDGETLLVTKGAPESVLARCGTLPDGAQAQLDAAFADGSRVVAVATRSLAAADGTNASPSLAAADERDLEFAGLLCFLDRPKASARDSLERLARLGIAVKIVTGDNGVVAEKVCRDIGLAVTGTMTGVDVDALDDTALLAALEHTTVFARVTPEQKARIIHVQRDGGSDVAFLGDGVNDAVALHRADVGISVESATDVAKDAADIVLLEKDLGVLADGVVEGRRIFANTIKYVLMGTSSNFGNMFSAAAASSFLKFLPMLPSQILLNNLLYDTSQMAIPTDRVDEETLTRPSHWDIAFVRRFMVFFGPISSVFDFATFGLMILVFRAHAPLFRSGWFAESLATQTLVIFVIRTRRRPFFKSRPSRPLALSAIGVVLVGAALPMSPLAHPLGFAHLPWAFFGALVLMVAVYMVVVEQAKTWFFARNDRRAPVPTMPRRHGRDRRHRVHRLAARWSRRGPIVPIGPGRADGGLGTFGTATPPGPVPR